MSDDPLNELAAVCGAAHADFFPSDGEHSETSMCLPASLALRDRLAAAGYQAVLAMGTFVIDDPDPEAYDGEDIDGEPPPHAYEPVHYWVMVGAIICDVTAGQFADECEHPQPEAVQVVYRDDAAAFRYTLIRLDPDVELYPDHQQWRRSVSVAAR